MITPIDVEKFVQEWTDWSGRTWTAAETDLVRRIKALLADTPEPTGTDDDASFTRLREEAAKEPPLITEHERAENRSKYLQKAEQIREARRLVATVDGAKICPKHTRSLAHGKVFCELPEGHAGKHREGPLEWDGFSVMTSREAEARIDEHNKLCEICDWGKAPVVCSRRRELETMR